MRTGAWEMRPPDTNVILEMQGFYYKDTEMWGELGGKWLDLAQSPNPTGISHWGTHSEL